MEERRWDGKVHDRIHVAESGLFGSFDLGVLGRFQMLVALPLG